MKFLRVGSWYEADQPQIQGDIPLSDLLGKKDGCDCKKQIEDLKKEIADLAKKIPAPKEAKPATVKPAEKK